MEESPVLPTEPTSSANRAVGMIMGAGAGVAIVSTFLNWASVTLDVRSLGQRQVTESKSGLDTSDGKIVLVLAFVLLAFAFVIYSEKAKGKVLPSIGIAAAAIILLVTIVDVSNTKKNTRKDFAKQLQKATGAQSGIIDEIAKRLEVRLGAGLYIALAGGAIAMFGSLVGLRLKAPAEFAGPPPAPPSDAPGPLVEPPSPLLDAPPEPPAPPSLE